MDFKTATDVLFTHARVEELAEILGVHEQSIRQARMKQEASGYRNPPAGWEAAVIKLAEKHSKELSQLAEKLRQENA